LIAAGLGTIIGIPLGKVQMTAVPAANRLEPYVWRSLRHARWNGGILFAARSAHAALHDGVLCMEVILGA